MTALGLLWDTVLKYFFYLLLKTNGYIIFYRKNAFHGLSPKSSHLIPKLTDLHSL